jgi:hypothetical protein
MPNSVIFETAMQARGSPSGWGMLLIDTGTDPRPRHYDAIQ